MNQQFENFVRFFKPDGKDRLSNLHEPREPMTTTLIAKFGDNWRFLIPKSDCGLVPLSEIRVDLYGQERGNCTNYGLALAEVGFLRRQQSELYYEMILKVNNAPTADSWRQFSLVRENGSELLGTFSSQTTDFDTYCNELQDWIENYPHTRVDVIRDGNLFKIRAWENGNFRIRNEKITVGIGEVSVLNTNTPTLSRQFIQTYVRAAYRTYDLVIGDDITEGNIFRYRDISYTATKSDSATSIKTALLGSADKKVSFLTTEAIGISVSLGVRKTINMNTPQIKALYQNSSGGQDKYRIEVENIQKGNIFQVLISSEPPILYTVQENDTIATVEEILNPDAGSVLSVGSGSTVTVNAVSGVREDANTNSPQIYVENGVFTSAATVDKYRIYVGTSVRKNNTYALGDKIVIAQDTDDYLSIGEKLDLIDGLYYEIATGNSFDCFAQKGPLYDEENIADVQLISSPIRRVSSQYLCDVVIPNNISRGRYNFVLNRIETVEGEQVIAETIASSNFFEADADPKDTSLIKFADLGVNFDYEYYEEGISQQIRALAVLRNEKPETTEILNQSVNNATIKGQVEIRKTFEIMVKAAESWYHRALNNAMRHKIVLLDGKMVSLTDYSVSDDIGAKKLKTAKGILYEERYLKKNFGKLWLDEANYLERVKIKVNFNEKIVALVIYNDYFRQEIIEEGEVFVPVGEYKWKVFVAGARGETIQLRVYQNGQMLETFILMCNRWNKANGFTRVYPYDELFFEETSDDSGVNDIVTIVENGIIADGVSEFSDEFGNKKLINGVIEPYEVSMEGQWRRFVEDGFYVIQVLDADGNWVTKYSIS